MTMFPVKQKNRYSCVLACIESLAKSKKMSISQDGLIKKYPDRTCMGQNEEGSIVIEDDLPYILRTLKLASSIKNYKFVSPGVGRSIIGKNKAKIQNGIFIHTNKCSNGLEEIHHCWLLEDISNDKFNIMDPTDGKFRLLDWKVLDTRECDIIICDN